MKKVKKLLKQRSTYYGLSILAGAFGVIITPDQAAVIAAGAAAVIGVIETCRDEKPGED